MKLFDALYVTYIVTDGMPDSVRREKMNMVASSFIGAAEPDEPKEQPEPNFATAWDDAAIESIVNKCVSYILDGFDYSRLNQQCPNCSMDITAAREYVLLGEIRMLVNGVLRVDPVTPCSILNRFEQSVIRSIAVAHRDYDHWNDK